MYRFPVAFILNSVPHATVKYFALVVVSWRVFPFLVGDFPKKSARLLQWVSFVSVHSEWSTFLLIFPTSYNVSTFGCNVFQV